MMSMHQPLIYEPKRCALLKRMVDRTYDEAMKRGQFLGTTPQEARVILSGRMIEAIEAGETNLETLQALALQEDKPQGWNLDADYWKQLM